MPHGKQEQSDDSCPSADDDEGWRGYWVDKGQPWRTEPAISPCRQYGLSQRRLIPPDKANGVYPFGGMQLNRADVEWLLATHENGRNPIDWNDEQQRTRVGLDLRGAVVSEADLSHLPLARLQGGLNFFEWGGTTEEERIAVALTMKKTTLREAQLQGAILIGAQLQEAVLIGAQLQGAYLIKAQLQGADLKEAQLQGADLREAQLQGAALREAQLQGADLREAQLQGAVLWKAQLQGAALWEAQLQGATLIDAQLQKADLRRAQLQKANLIDAQLQGAVLIDAQLQGANLIDAQLQKADLRRAELQGVDLRRAELQGVDLRKACLVKAQLDSAILEGARLDDVILSDEQGIGPHVVDIQWGDTNLAVAKWSQVRMLGDEYETQQNMSSSGKEKTNADRLQDYERAVRANRQLAVVLRNQGLNEVADGFAFRAQVLQWHVLQRQRLEQLKQVQTNLQEQERGNQGSHELKRLSLSQLVVILLCWPSSILSAMRLSPDDHPLWRVPLLILQLVFLVYLLLLALIVFLPFLLQWLRRFIIAVLRGSMQVHRCSFLQTFVGLPTSTCRLFVKTLADHASSAFSVFLNVLAGYGYRPARTLCWYIAVVLGFASFYARQAPVIKAGNPNIRLDGIGALIFSITAFHGRGLFLGGEFGYDHPVAIFGALEAMIGLLIELSFVATFTGRFFRR